jgi:hypothetical protein
MAKQFIFDISETVNDMIACDQMYSEIDANVVIDIALENPPVGLICTQTVAQFNFVTDLSNIQETELLSVVQAHTGVGLPSANALDNLTVATLPSAGNSGDTFYVTDGVGGPGPAYFDGADWRWYSDGSVVV